jgi:hypothetical protein
MYAWRGTKDEKIFYFGIELFDQFEQFHVTMIFSFHFMFLENAMLTSLHQLGLK